MVTADIKVLMVSLLLKLVFTAGSMLPPSTTYLNNWFHNKLIVPHCHEESLKLPHNITHWGWWTWHPQHRCILTSNKNYVLPTKQMKSCRAELNVQPWNGSLCTQHALLEDGDCSWLPWCAAKWHSLPSPGARLGWLKVRVTALHTRLSSQQLQWKG